MKSIRQKQIFLNFGPWTVLGVSNAWLTKGEIWYPLKASWLVLVQDAINNPQHEFVKLRPVEVRHASNSYLGRLSAEFLGQQSR